MMQVSIPGRVWYDALDPMVSGMQNELGLPQPRTQRKGRGITLIYDNVTIKQALELAYYLQDRADTLGNQYGIDPQDRELYRTMHSIGHRIRKEAGA